MRTRDKIEEDSRKATSYIMDLELVLEVLLDIRDLLKSTSVSKQKLEQGNRDVI